MRSLQQRAMTRWWRPSTVSAGTVDVSAISQPAVAIKEKDEQNQHIDPAISNKSFSIRRPNKSAAIRRKEVGGANLEKIDLLTVFDVLQRLACGWYELTVNRWNVGQTLLYQMRPRSTAYTHRCQSYEPLIVADRWPQRRQWRNLRVLYTRVGGAVIIAVSFFGAQLAPLEQHLHRPIIFCQSCGNTAAGGRNWSLALWRLAEETWALIRG